MLLFLSDDEHEQFFQIKQRDKIKITVEHNKESVATYGAYYMW